MRLDRFVAHASPHSRSEVRRLARSGRLCVNGVPVRDAGTVLAPGDTVTLDGSPLHLRGQRYFMLHKPAGVICATEDGMHRTVLDLLPAADRPGLHVAGRLDIDSTGLVLVTDDGAWSHRLTAPGRHDKRYRVRTARPIAPESVARFAAGLALRGEEDDPTLPARLEITAPCEALVWLQEGRYHQVRRMFAATGNHVEALHREAVAGIELDPELPPGGFRPLTPAEIACAGTGRETAPAVNPAPCAG
jgi:16S rRNA pseudouridine516 synthase